MTIFSRSVHASVVLANSTWMRTVAVRGQVCTCRMVSLCVEIRRVVEWAKWRISLSFSRITRVGEVYCVRRTTGTLVKLSNGAAVSAGAIAKCGVSERSLTAFRVLVVLARACYDENTFSYRGIPAMYSSGRFTTEEEAFSVISDPRRQRRRC